MMPGTDEELDDEWESSKEEAAEGPNSKRATIRVPPFACHRFRRRSRRP